MIPSLKRYAPRNRLYTITNMPISRQWVVLFPKVFPPLYANEKERTFLFVVRPDPDFQKAFELYIAANLDLEHSARQSGLLKLKKALQLAPGFRLAQDAISQARKIE